MRILIISLVLLQQARCEWDRLQKELLAERNEDAHLHGCRNCREVPVVAGGCPDLGYECDPNWPIQTTVLSASDCSCATAWCADRKAKMIVNGTTRTDKLRCRQGKWTAGDEEVEHVICAKDCGRNACKSSHPNASALFTSLDVIEPNGNTRCAVAESCKAGSAALNADGTLDKNLGTTVTVTCSGDGLWKVESEKYEYIMCNTPPPCDKCDPSKILMETDAACTSPTTATDILCTSMPMPASDAGGCPSLSCPSDQSLCLVINGQERAMQVSAADVSCSGGKWLYTPTDPIPETAAGFVCAQAASCDACQSQVAMFYQKSESVDFDNVASGPKLTCQYKCPTNYNLITNQVKYGSVFCDMITKSVTLDSPKGTTLSTSYKFDCVECKCNQAVLRGIESVVCPQGSLCTFPEIDPVIGACMATCPADTIAIYKAADGSTRISTTIPCTANNKWITDDSDQLVGVTCQYADPTKGYTVTQPVTSNPCPQLAEGGCPKCENKNLIYIPTPDGRYSVLCKEGALLTDKFGETDQGVFTCLSTGKWDHDITEVTCDMGDTAGLNKCIPLLTDPSTTGEIKAQCSFGSCYFKCKDSMLEYVNPVTGAVERIASLKCNSGEIEGLFGSLPDPSQIKCV